jgi:hypothetical protein
MPILISHRKMIAFMFNNHLAERILMLDRNKDKDEDEAHHDFG